MMQCRDCDTDLQDDAKFCHNCGREAPNPTPRRGRALFDDIQKDRKRSRGESRKSSLADRDERVLWTGSFSAKGLIHSWLLAALITIVLPLGGMLAGASSIEWSIIIGIVALVWVGLAVLLFLQRLNVHYELTDQRLIHRSGILLRRTNRIELIDMDDVSHEQGIIERMFDVGTIEISSSDRSHPLIELPGISNVEQIAMLIDDARRRERIRRGIHIESI